MGAVMDGEATPAQLAALLMGLRMRGETVDELAGFATAMRERVVRVEAPDGTVDVVGTGGDGSGTFNISTASALVARRGRRAGRQARQPRHHLEGGLGRRPGRARRPDRSRRRVGGGGPARARLRVPVRPRTSTRRCATRAPRDARSACGRRSTCSGHSPTRPARAGSCWASATRRRPVGSRRSSIDSARSGRSWSTARGSTSCRSMARGVLYDVTEDGVEQPVRRRRGARPAAGRHLEARRWRRGHERAIRGGRASRRARRATRRRAAQRRRGVPGGGLGRDDRGRPRTGGPDHRCRA